MPIRSGRLEKRTRLAVPVSICSLKEPAAGERSTTENICSLGLRVLVRHARELNERVLIKSGNGELHADARVVYCERLADGRFALGLEFHGEATSWLKRSLGHGD
jgi:PilZ domain